MFTKYITASRQHNGSSTVCVHTVTRRSSWKYRNHIVKCRFGYAQGVYTVIRPNDDTYRCYTEATLHIAGDTRKQYCAPCLLWLVVCFRLHRVVSSAQMSSSVPSRSLSMYYSLLCQTLYPWKEGLASLTQHLCTLQSGLLAHVKGVIGNGLSLPLAYVIHGGAPSTNLKAYLC